MNLPTVRRFFAAGLLLAAMATSANGGRLREIQEFRLADLNGLKASDTNVGVYGIRFSPDGKQIAVIFGRSLKDQAVVVLQTRDMTAGAVKLAGNPGYLPGAMNHPQWSLSGDFLRAGSLLYHLPNGNCTVPMDSQFIGSDRLMAYQFKPSRFRFFDTECHLSVEWPKLSEGEHVKGFLTSPERGIAMVDEETIRGLTMAESMQEFIDAKDSRVIRKSVWRAATATTEGTAMIREAAFADNGRVACGVVGQDTSARVSCHSTDTGTLLASTDGGSFPHIQCSLNSTRVVITEFHKRLDFIDFFWYAGSVTKQLIWDFQTGTILAARTPHMQKTANPTAETFYEKSVAANDISPDGEYLVEGWENRVRLLKIEPQ